MVLIAFLFVSQWYVDIIRHASNYLNTKITLLHIPLFECVKYNVYTYFDVVIYDCSTHLKQRI